MDGQSISTSRKEPAAPGMLVVLGCVAALWSASAAADLASATSPASATCPTAAAKATPVHSEDQASVDSVLARNRPTLLGRDDSGGSSPIWQALSSVLVILTLGALTVVAIKRLGPRMGLPMGKGKRVQVLETTFLGQRKTVHLLQVGKKKFLVGGSPNGVSLLAEVTDSLDDK